MAAPREWAAHWDDAYRAIGVESVSWFEPEPTMSLALIDALGTGPDDAVLDVGGGASTLVDDLLRDGYGALTVLDLSAAALAAAQIFSLVLDACCCCCGVSG